MPTDPMTALPSIIPRLLARQKEQGGYLTNSDLRGIADELSVPLYRIESIVSFYPHFRRSPPAQVTVRICRDMTCHLRGSVALTTALSQISRNRTGERVEICGTSCLGRCDRAPAVMINDHLYVQRTELDLQQIIDQHVQGQVPEADSDMEFACSKIGKWKMDVYENQPRYDAVRRYLADPNPDHVLAALEHAGLLGMGGAGGRAYLKWGDVLRAAGSEKFIVCNADESEPGTFKDRDILLVAPHLTLEGMVLAALVVGARRGWIYIRHEYHEQIERVQQEIQRATRAGVLGENILGSERSFYVDVYVSPGGYICGEQTALIEALEDRRAEPRNRPPELMTNGYRNQPTLLNNVETFAWVPAIMLRAAGQWYRDQGCKSGPWIPNSDSAAIRGMRLFSISGDVQRPGVYEVPTGIPLGTLIDDFAGGMIAGKELLAVALSGPSGGLLPAQIPVSQLNRRFVESVIPAGVPMIDIREIPLDITVSRAAGVMIGAGIVVYGTGADLLAEALACSRFFRNESCGKCVPCRIGSQKITEIGQRLHEGGISEPEIAFLGETAAELANVMTATSICGLGQVASNPILSMLRFFPEWVGRGKKS